MIFSQGRDEHAGWEPRISTAVLPRCWARAQGPSSLPSPTRPDPAGHGPQAHLKAVTHVWRHDDLVALAVHLSTPQELALGGRDVVLAAVVAQLDALLQDQKHALRHVLIRRLRGIAEEPLCDFLGAGSEHA